MPNDALPFTSCPTWMKEQHRTFMEQLVDQPANSAWIGVASVDNIVGRNGTRTRRRDGQVALLGDEPENEVIVWKPDKTSWAPELWISPTRRDYRSVYARFIEAYWPGGNIDDVPHHVDHLFPKEPAVLGGLSHVRVLAIPKRSNVSAGTFEKQMTAKNYLQGARTKQTRMATLYSLAKAMGYVGYAGLKTLEGRRRIAADLMQALREAGAPKEIVESRYDEALLVETLDCLR